MPPKGPRPFFSRCVEWPEEHLGRLAFLVDNGEAIGRGTFLRHVDRDALAQLECQLGYASHPSRGLTMAGDRHVTYERWGRIYWFTWSAIEYVFAAADQIRDVPEF